MSKKILMVDDELEYIEAHIQALKDEGYEVEKVMEVDHAVQVLDKDKFDLIILDMLMPPSESDRETPNIELRETGLRLYITIRETLQLRDIPILFMTVLRDKTIIKKIKDAEEQYGKSAEILTKPVALDELIERVKRYIPSSNDKQLG
jgi:CheY-like chemotaxis protein